MDRVPFAGIVRSTGTRTDSLAEALQSISFQNPPAKAVVVVHGDAGALKSVSEVCASVPALDYTVLHAPDRTRKRGYPLNVGLRYCLDRDPAFEFVFFLDDDDIVYPFFTRILSDAFLHTSADLVYTPANQRNGEQTMESPHRLDSVLRLLTANFITINGYAVRAASLQQAGVCFEEDFDYLEDWNFLIDLLAKGLQFEPCTVPISEFRITSDGNTEARKRPDLWQRDLMRIRNKVSSGKFPIPGPQLCAHDRYSAPGQVSMNQADISDFKEKFLNPPDNTEKTEELLALLSNLEQSLAESSAALAGRDRQAGDDARLIRELQSRVADLESSLSWRITAPLRSILDSILRLRGDYRLGDRSR
jgi:hypothetical protein